MKNIPIEFLIKMMAMPRIGRKTALKLLELVSFDISDDQGLSQAISEHGRKLHLPDYSKGDFVSAFSDSDRKLANSKEFGIKNISFQDDNYPKLLGQISDFPLVLFYKGDFSTLTKLPCVAIIGTRDASNFGIKISERLGKYFASSGFNVISGLAIGCDTAAHKGALKEGGATTAVLAHGLDKVYPTENTSLAEEIFNKGGLLLSEYIVDEKTQPHSFAERDRIQAGLSLGTIVIETDIEGGTMHAVKACLENKRILAAVNHPTEYFKNATTEGNQQLIRTNQALPIFHEEEVANLLLKLQTANNKHSNFEKLQPRQAKLW